MSVALKSAEKAAKIGSSAWRHHESVGWRIGEKRGGNASGQRRAGSIMAQRSSGIISAGSIAESSGSSIAKWHQWQRGGSSGAINFSA